MSRVVRRRAAVALFFLLYTLAVTWPGMVPFNRIRPLVLGLPFSMVWVAGWVLAGGVVLFWLDRAEPDPSPRAEPDLSPPAAGDPGGPAESDEPGKSGESLT